VHVVSATVTLNLCARCVGHSHAQTLPINPDILAMLVAWQRAPTPKVAQTTRCSERQLANIERLLGLFLKYHLDAPLPSRALALEVLAHVC